MFLCLDIWCQVWIYVGLTGCCLIRAGRSESTYIYISNMCICFGSGSKEGGGDLSRWSSEGLWVSSEDADDNVLGEAHIAGDFG